MKYLYNLTIHAYTLAIRIASLFNPKARKWIEGRRNIFEELEQQFTEKRPVKSFYVWVHAASLGEFEQGRPVMEEIKRKYPDTKIILTFFSPSGYEIRKDYEGADYVCYLPADTPRNVCQFIDLVQPDLAIFVKYEFWRNYLTTLELRGTPTLLISAIFREKQIFFRPYGQMFRRMLTCFDHLFVQDDFSLKLLHKNGITNVTTTGDTRMDRVYELSRNPKKFPLIEAFVAHQDTLICGSTWQEDEAWLLPFLNEKKTKTILAPHDISEAHIRYITEHLTVKTVRYSQANNDNICEAQVLIIDNIGMLSSIYQYGKWAYIGGGFGASIHNTQEAFVYGLPVIFGPKYDKFKEATDLLALGGGFVVHSAAEFEAIFEQLQDETTYAAASQICLDYVTQNRGATAKIMSYLEPYFDQKPA